MSESIQKTGTQPASHIVCELGSHQEQVWTNFVEGHRDANCYHSLLWKGIIQDVFGHRPFYLMVENEGKVSGVLPLFLVKVPFVGSKLLSLPYDIGSGGVLSGDPMSSQALLTYAIDLAKRLRVDYFQIRGANRRPEFDGLGFSESSPVFISEMELTTEKEVLSGISKDHRKGIRKSEARGVSVREASTWEDFEKFFNVYVHVFRDFGTPPYSKSYFRLIHQRLLPIGATRILLAEVQGTCIGGLLLFCGGKNLVSKFAVCLPEYVDRRTYVLLYWRAIQLGIELGFQRLSWGTSSVSQTGLIAFKEGWGSTTRPAMLMSLSVDGIVPNIEHYYDSEGFLRRCWKKLPLRVTQVGGGVLNQWFC